MDEQPAGVELSPLNNPATNSRLLAGDLFFLILWLQSQMIDLLILQERPDLVDPFLSDPSTLSREYADLRYSMTADTYDAIKREFVSRLARSLTEEDVGDLDYLGVIRNALAHSHVSLGRDHFLYRPSRGDRQEAAILEATGLEPNAESAQPMILKLSMTEARYLSDFARIQRLDEECLSRIAAEVGVPHSRVR